MTVVAVFADGGVIQHNPSDYGGTWGCCHVDQDDVRVLEMGGVILPSEVETTGVTNNQSEFMAMLQALEALPDGWSGKACSDSNITLMRFFGCAKMRGIPVVWGQRMSRVLGRLGTITPVLLSGHPTRAHLASGVGKHGTPVSVHNAWCDKRCNLEGVRYLLQIAR